MSKQDEFKKKMGEIFPEEGYDPMEAHQAADCLMVEELESLGYDLSDFNKATVWYA